MASGIGDGCCPKPANDDILLESVVNRRCRLARISFDGVPKDDLYDR